MEDEKWTFWIDCGGTFTDIIAVNSKSQHKVHKLLSHSPHYESAVVQGIEDLLGHNDFSCIEEVRLGTTVATNAFLERKGIPCALITTLGHRDVLEIRNQNREDLFALDIKKTKPLYSSVTHIEGRMNAKGEVLVELDEDIAIFELSRILDKGIKSLAISLMHSTVNPAHELKLKEIALDLGFEYISLSHQVSPLAKYVARTETSVIDAYLSPYLAQYTEELSQKLGIKNIFYMQSDGGLCTKEFLKGHNALLSGPAGGLIGAADEAKKFKRDKIITFDMGGTSTDVAIYDRELSIDPTPDFYGLKLLSPMVDIHTVAAGGGSVLSYDNGRFKVGPESAGAYPGPACYRNGGPLTITDANLFLGRIDPSKFPHIFGPDQNQPLDEKIVREKFNELASQTGLSAKEVAEGFIEVAVETMGRAIKKVSIEKGLDPKDFMLVSFGGAAGQLALKVAQNLQMKEVLIHPLSSVLSAYGIGCALHQVSEQGKSSAEFDSLISKAKDKFPYADFEVQKSFLLKASGSDHTVEINADDFDQASERFQSYHEKTFRTKADSIEEVSVAVKLLHQKTLELKYDTEAQKIYGPKILSENKTSIVIEKGWSAEKSKHDTWLFSLNSEIEIQKRDPKIELEIFFQRFQFIAEQMGIQLQRLARSINIRERNDFSCALFTKDCELIANAPHIPVHLGSMDQAVKAVAKSFDPKPLESFILNSPFHGGTHLPDVTIVTPVHYENEIVMWVASRGHHADIGGKSPGSMPGDSKTLEEEGVIITPIKNSDSELVDKNLLEKILLETKYPVRDFKTNLHDIQAKVSANLKGVADLKELIQTSGVDYINSMSEKILDYTHQKIQNILEDFTHAIAEKEISSDRRVKVELKRENDKTVFDFQGSSPRLNSNFNAPTPVVQASILFALRSMIEEAIPLNSGVLRAIEIKIPENCMLNPKEDSPVVAGNVETSQAVCDLIFQALKVKANSYGSMNNLSFGNDRYQYYETICGGSGATKTAAGASAVQVNMTNSLLTDPEVMETRLPVLIELMGIRHGSGGDGAQRGGDGVYRRIKFLENMSVNMITQARKMAPQGLAGGQDAKRGLNLIEFDGLWFELPECFERNIKAGTRLSINTPGGGGFGKANTSNKHYVFGFGSNMDLEQIRTRCPSAELICRAKVFDKEIRYTRYSPIRLGGVADMCEAEGKFVYGLVVSINDEDLATLDKIECDDNGYQRIEVEAIDDNKEKLTVFAYDVIDKKPDIPPTVVYEWLVYTGAYYLDAPPKYLERIRSFR